MMSDSSPTDQDWSSVSSLPGNPIMWVLIVSELLVFGAILLGFAVAKYLDPVTFQAGQAALDVRMGGLNTVILVCSGWLAALAVQSHHGHRQQRFHWQLAGAACCGLAFLVVKLIEWQRELAAGHGLESDAFFTLFFLTTGFHAAHVVMGLVILGIVSVTAKADGQGHDGLKTGIAFWHMVDLVWLLIFPVFYLSR